MIFATAVPVIAGGCPTRACAWCRHAFPLVDSRQLYCGPKCRKEAEKKRRHVKGRTPRACAFNLCGKWFNPRRSHQRYHTILCRAREGARKRSLA